MSDQLAPLVSVVIPMYNNAEYVAECIESVLAQTYAKWDCVIINNCSTDGSGEIARRFANLDPRIRVMDNEKLLPVMVNHNHGLRQISPASKYCKIVYSDDWLFPRCLEEMVAVAEANPSVGIVGAYGLQGVEVKWTGLPYPSSRVDGRTVCRRFWLDDLYVFGTSQSLLYRADLVRNHDPFFNEASLHSDREICFDLLRNCDFGFVHQVLTFSRERPGSLTDIGRRSNTSVGARLYELVTFGPAYLTPREHRDCLSNLVDEYYNFLAVSKILGGRDATFWNYHKQKFKEAGLQFSNSRLATALLARSLKALANPGETIDKLKMKRAVEA